MEFLHKCKQYALLMRLHRPIGSVLLLWPTLLALWLASDLQPDFRLVVIFSLGVMVMRSAGVVINDYADRNFDGHVKRTQHRPLATGKVSAKEALCLFIVLLIVALFLVSLTSAFTQLLSIGAVLLASLYPFMKRYTHFPQVILGAAFGWGIPMAYAAQKGSVTWDAWVLFAANCCWVLAYDTLYAMADREDDLKVGIKSTAIFFGGYDKLAVLLFHLIALGLLVFLGIGLSLNQGYFWGLLGAFFFVIYQLWLVRHREPAACIKAFLNNQWLGFSIVLGLLLC